MANEQQKPQPQGQTQPQPAEIKTTITADEKRRADSAKVACVVTSGRLIAGDPDDPSKQRVYEEGESIELPQKQADELKAGGYVVFSRLAMAAAYLTLADLQSAVGAAQVLRLLDDDGDGVADAAAVSDVLTRAETFVRGHVGRVYPMPVVLADAATLDGIRALAVPVAVHYAFQRRTEFTTRDGSPYQMAYSEAVKTLRDIGAGKYRLDTSGAPVSPANSGGGPRYGTIDNLTPTIPFARGGTGLF